MYSSIIDSNWLFEHYSFLPMFMLLGWIREVRHSLWDFLPPWVSNCSSDIWTHRRCGKGWLIVCFLSERSTCYALAALQMKWLLSSQNEWTHWVNPSHYLKFIAKCGNITFTRSGMSMWIELAAHTQGYPFHTLFNRILIGILHLIPALYTSL